MSTPALSRATWRKSTRSGDNGGACVEVAHLDGAALLRDSKDKGNGPILVCPASEWTAFITRATTGTLHRP
ncbi:MAG: DUF397 domain-containing protein [Pseudonocardiaceae bacterium]